MHETHAAVRSFGLTLLAVGGILASTSAQCGPVTLPGLGAPGVGYFGMAPGAVYASTTWDPDGSGPATAVLVIAGSFTTAGNTIANNIAAIDPATGVVTAFGSGTDGIVRALTVAANGDLVAAGEFVHAGNTAAFYVASWNGSAWSALGSGLGGWAHALTTMANGDIVVGGQFNAAGGSTANLVARWNGTAWSAIGALNPSAQVWALATLPSGDLVAGGNVGLVHWNGTTWSPLGGYTNHYVKALLRRSNGDLVIGGEFTAVAGVPANRIARWDGASWSAFGSGTDDTVASLAELPNGDVLLGGDFRTAGGSPANYVARWNGTALSGLGTGMTYGLTYGYLPGVYALTALPGGDIFAGGAFRSADGTACSSLARWHGTAWSPVFSGTNGTVLDAIPQPSGGWIVSGGFTTIAGTAANRIAHFDGTNWTALGTGLDNTALTATFLANGDLVVGGRFQNAGGNPAANLARWDGTAWHPVGGGVDGDVFAVATLPNGDLIVGGGFNNAGPSAAGRCARWDGAMWHPMGALDAAVQCLRVGPSGELYAAGFFRRNGTVVLNAVARWTGTTWAPLGNGLQASIAALAVAANGDLLAGGHAVWPNPNHVQRWNGTDWTPVGGAITGQIAALEVLPAGDVLVAGRIGNAGGATVRSIARFDGTAWTEFAGGTLHGAAALTLAMHDSGELFVGGEFLGMSGAVNAFFARIVSSCAATTTTLGAGCNGTTGPLVMTVDQQPWLGAAFATTTTGFAPGALAFWELGFTTSATPLAALHPAAGAGCTQWVNFDILAWPLVPNGGVARASLSLPNAPVFAGLVFHHQVGQMEFGPSLNLTHLSTSNAVTATAGVF